MKPISVFMVTAPFLRPMLFFSTANARFSSLGRVLALSIVMAGCGGAAAGPIESQPVEIPNGDLKLKAALYRPAGSGPFPAVVGLHACGGLSNRTGVMATRYRDWGQRLAESGFAVIYPDSYGSRGLSNQCGVRARSARSSRERLSDAHAARRWLQSQPWVAADRISLIGWASGGVAALWTVRARSPVKEAGPDFRSAIAFYPGCRRLGEAAWSARVPTLILIGGADDQAPASACEQMVAGARGRSARVAIQVYPRAHHDFDHPNRPVHVRTGYAFSADGSGRIHTGTDAAARADALKRVPEWLSR
jgi:dienelactone hydrolase